MPDTGVSPKTYIVRVCMGPSLLRAGLQKLSDPCVFAAAVADPHLEECCCWFA